MSFRLLHIALVLGVALGPAGCADDSEVAAPPPPAREPRATVTPLPTETSAFAKPQQPFPPYEPPSAETYINGKRLAGRIAQQLLTFGDNATAREIAESVGTRGVDRARVAAAVAPLVDPHSRSTGEVIYVQLSGVTATTLGTMVVIRQHLEDAKGARRQVVRVVDVRLSKSADGWLLDRIGSVGGQEVERPTKLSAAAVRVLRHPKIELPDTARWDIYRGLIDDALLRRLADAADRWPISVTVLRTGHPDNVWGTPRPSAHTAGKAADIYAVAGSLVVEGRAPEGAAWELADSFVRGGAAQVGSPWVFRAGPSRSFSDVVHEDHIHVQQSPGVRDSTSARN